MPCLILDHKPPFCDDVPHRDGTFRGWLRWTFATVKCEGRK